MIPDSTKRTMTEVQIAFSPFDDLGQLCSTNTPSPIGIKYAPSPGKPCQDCVRHGHHLALNGYPIAQAEPVGPSAVVFLNVNERCSSCLDDPNHFLPWNAVHVDELLEVLRRFVGCPRPLGLAPHCRFQT